MSDRWLSSTVVVEANAAVVVSIREEPIEVCVELPSVDPDRAVYLRAMTLRDGYADSYADDLEQVNESSTIQDGYGWPS